MCTAPVHHGRQMKTRWNTPAVSMPAFHPAVSLYFNQAHVHVGSTHQLLATCQPLPAYTPVQ